MISLSVSVVLPILIAVVCALYGDLVSRGWWYFAIPLSFLSIIQLYLACTQVVGDRLIHEVYHDSEEIFEYSNNLLDRIHGLEMMTHQLFAHTNIVLLWMPMLNDYIANSVKDDKCMVDCIDRLMALVIKSRYELFDMGRDEIWNFAIYRHDNKAGALVPIWRRKHEDIPTLGLGRSWAVGTGHVGKAFADKRAIITANAADPMVSDLMSAPETNRRDYDQKIYRSFAAIPIQIGGLEGRPLGVVVGTSSAECRFGKDNSMILYHLANVLAMMMNVNHIQSDAKA